MTLFQASLVSSDVYIHSEDLISWHYLPSLTRIKSYSFGLPPWFSSTPIDILSSAKNFGRWNCKPLNGCTIVPFRNGSHVIFAIFQGKTTLKLLWTYSTVSGGVLPFFNIPVVNPYKHFRTPKEPFISSFSNQYPSARLLSTRTSAFWRHLYLWFPKACLCFPLPCYSSIFCFMHHVHSPFSIRVASSCLQN